MINLTENEKKLINVIIDNSIQFTEYEMSLYKKDIDDELLNNYPSFVHIYSKYFAFHFEGIRLFSVNTILIGIINKLDTSVFLKILMEIPEYSQENIFLALLSEIEKNYNNKIS